MLAVQGEPCWEPDMATKHTASFVSSHVPRRPVERATGCTLVVRLLALRFGPNGYHPAVKPRLTR